jgi:hypothetical protein
LSAVQIFVEQIKHPLYTPGIALRMDGSYLKLFSSFYLQLLYLAGMRSIQTKATGRKVYCLQGRCMREMMQYKECFSFDTTLDGTVVEILYTIFSCAMLDKVEGEWISTL